jgi:citrate lyase subunit beta/citryl-CoA lyase
MERIARSLLFVPGNRPERFDKAAASGAHQVILDLEDAVAPEAKAGARAAAAAWLAAGRQAVVVRINGADTPWFRDDLSMVQAAPGAGVVVPKADAATLPEVAAALPGRHLIALLETVEGWMELDRLAAVPGLSRIAFGSIDFALETGIADEGDAMTSIRTRIVLASCHAGLAPPVDGVSVEVADEALMQRHALRSLQLGFGGKLCIHPRQVAAVNAAFRPQPSQVDWALRVLAAFEASGGAATAVDGKMVDKPVVEQARRIAAEGGGN